MPFNTIVAFLIGLILLFAFGRLLVVPIRILIKLLINGLIGGVFLFLFNLFGSIFNLSIAINPLNALIVGFLGVPGVIILLIYQMIM